MLLLLPYEDGGGTSNPLDSWKLPLSVVIMGQMSREITWLNLPLCVSVCVCVSV